MPFVFINEVPVFYCCGTHVSIGFNGNVRKIRSKLCRKIYEYILKQLEPVRFEAFVYINSGLPPFSRYDALLYVILDMSTINVKTPHDYLAGRKIKIFTYLGGYAQTQFLNGNLR